MNIKEVRRYLQVIKRAVAYIEAELEEDGGLLESLCEETVHSKPQEPPQLESEPEPEPEPEPESAPVVQPDPDWRELRAKHVEDLLNIDVWPEAVPAFLAAEAVRDQDQIHRANAILDMMLDRDVKGLHFLDFGCGEGWITQQALERGVESSTGYDIEKSEAWSRVKGPRFTTTLSQLERNHFDVIMLYDVLDHCKDPEGVMKSVLELLKWGGTVYVRCHPWTSRHGNHLYKSGINKAYMHLFLTLEEQAELIDKSPLFTRQEMQPVDTYRKWFSHFDIQKERLVREPVHEFFFNPAFIELLGSEQHMDEETTKGLMTTMEVQFVDFSLTPKVN